MTIRQIAIAGVLSATVHPASHAVTIGYQYSVKGSSGNGTITSTAGTSNLQFTDGSGDVFQLDSFGTTLIVGKNGAFVGPDVQTPDTFDAPYTLTLKILDEDAGGDVTLTFTGRLTGHLTQRQSNLVNTFDAPTTRSATLNGTTFTVTMLSFCPPGPPVSSEPGSFLAYITTAPTATAVSGVALTPSAAKIGGGVQGTVTLNGPAPRGGATVALTAASALGLPPTVSVPAGATSAIFFASGQAANANVSVSAAWNGTSASKPMSIGAALCGDFNGDGNVTILDAARLLRSVAGLEALPNC